MYIHLLSSSSCVYLLPLEVFSCSLEFKAMRVSSISIVSLHERLALVGVVPSLVGSHQLVHHLGISSDTHAPINIGQSLSLGSHHLVVVFNSHFFERFVRTSVYVYKCPWVFFSCFRSINIVRNINTNI
jgi:hypothetical protein